MIYPPAAENPLHTHADLQRLLHDLTVPLRHHFTAGRAGITLGHPQPWYGEPVASLEGYARPLWGLVPFALGGGKFGGWSEWREGLVHGVDPAHPEFWGWPTDRDQRNVELPVIALAVALVPEEMWHPLSAAQQARVADWLNRINAVELVDNNWRFFRVLTNLALRRLDRPWSRTRLDSDLHRLDQFYIGHGWYSDGLERHGDYYVPMAFHFYGLLFAALAGSDEANWTEKFRERARDFAPTFQHWFAADGEAVPFGRSLTYRCAQGAFWGALAYTSEEALPWGVIKGLYLRHLRWWMSQSIFTETGLLTVGYRYPNCSIGENYNGHGSPYWAFKAFLPLALDNAHPFWRAAEAHPDLGGGSCSVPEAGMILSWAPERRLVVALNAGQPVLHYPRHAAAKYSKCVYSTHFGFGVATSDIGTLAGGGFDSVFALSDDSVRFRPRGTCVETIVDHGVAFSVWHPWPDVEVRTWLFPVGTHHVRVHRVRSAQPIWSSDAGFALGQTNPTELEAVTETPDEIVLHATSGSSAIRELLSSRVAEWVRLEPNSHLAWPIAAMPTLRGMHAPGIFWAVAVYGAASNRDDSLLSELREFRADASPTAVTVTRNGQRLFHRTDIPG